MALCLPYAAQANAIEPTLLKTIDSLKKDKPKKALDLIKTELAKIDKKAQKELFFNFQILKGEVYLGKKAIDTTLSLGWRIIDLAKKLGDPKLLEAYKLLGNTYLDLYLSDSALFYFEKAYQLEFEKTAAQKLYLLQRLSILHSENGSLSKALDYCISGIRIAEKNEKAHFIAVFNNRIGFIYERQNNLKKALEFYLKAKEAYTQLGDEIGVATSLSNIGLAMLSLKQYDEAKKSFEEAKTIYTKLNDNKGIASMIGNLGLLQYKQGNIKGAVDLQKQALQLRIKDKNYGDLPQSYVALANSYLKLGRYDDALELTRNGIGITKQTGADAQLLVLFKQFYLIYKDLNYKDSALWYHEKFLVLKDSLDRLDNDDLIIRLQNAFDTERRELELTEIKRENELQDVRLSNLEELKKKDNILKIMLISIIVVLLVLAVLSFSRYRIKSIANKEISRKVKENELLLKELHHRVKNNLQFISSLFSIKLQKINDPDARQILDENLQKVRAMSLVHNLLNLNPEQDPNLNLHSFIKGLCNSIVLSLGLDEDQLQLMYRWRKAAFDMDSFNSIGLVLNEMITNTVKHCDSEDLAIKISFFENEKFKMIRYSDNGPGLDKNFFIEERQMGMTLIKLLVEDIGGVLKYHQPKEGETGIRISINIKKNTK